MTERSVAALMKRRSAGGTKQNCVAPSFLMKSQYLIAFSILGSAYIELSSRGRAGATLPPQCVSLAVAVAEMKSSPETIGVCSPIALI